jgi:hypothetical protein
MPIHHKTRQNPSNKDSRSRRFAGCLLATCALPAFALAADNPGAHEHGKAQLQMALEDTSIDLIFTSPAYNLAGFEHQARTPDEKKRLADIRDWLETMPLINTEAGTCRVKTASVQLGGETESHHDHHNDKAAHRDYEVTQQLRCEEIGSGEIFSSPLPRRFPELETLTIEWIAPTGQGSTLMTPSAVNFNLGE